MRAEVRAREGAGVRDLLPELLGWWRAGDRAAVATVVRTFRSAPPGPTASAAPGSPSGRAAR